MLRRTLFFAIAALLVAPFRSDAQTPAAITLDSVVYADNVEFSGPFRTGETILGSSQRFLADIAASDVATFRLGVYLLERAGSNSPVDVGLPIVSLIVRNPRHRFVLGTLDTGAQTSGMGPDRTTRHGLLPPFSIETDWFTHAYEAGFQYATTTDRVKQETWFNYQKMNTPQHRELFDAGSVGRIGLVSPIALAYQWHIVHHGGQQFHNGPVTDSIVTAPGVSVEGVLPVVGRATVETFVPFSFERPDRENPSLNVTGQAIFIRLAAERDRWRGHAIIWRANDFRHEGGDPNYRSEYPDSAPYVGTRDYSEAGLTRLFKPAPTIDLESSLRLHRVERNWSYSYRVMATVHLGLWQTAVSPPRRDP